MEKVYAVIFYVLLTVGAVTAQIVKPPERVLPQWLTGLIAVAGFLALAFVSVLVKKAWCDEPRKRSSAVPVNENNIEENPYDIDMDATRKKDQRNSYDNKAFESTEVRMTSM